MPLVPCGLRTSPHLRTSDLRALSVSQSMLTSFGCVWPPSAYIRSHAQHAGWTPLGPTCISVRRSFSQAGTFAQRVAASLQEL